MQFLIVLLAFASLSAAYVVQPPTLSLLTPQGLRISYPHDDPGITLVSYHYSINKALPGVGAGDYNVDVTSPTGAFWIHDNTGISLSTGDTVNYWVYVVVTGIGYQLTDQSWTVSSGASSLPTTFGPPPSTTSGISPGQSTLAPPQTQPCSSGYNCTSYPCLIFQDNFDTLDLNTWEHEITAGGGGNWEFQYYTNNRSNSYAKNGVLYIKPTLTSDKFNEAFLTSGTLDIWGSTPASECTGNAYWGCFRTGNPTNIINPIQSARLRSTKSFSFRYGKVEISAKLPKGDWIWPAIWMMSKRESYGGWPASGEIDIMESRGNRNLADEFGNPKGATAAASTFHWGPFFPYNGFEKTTTESQGNFGDMFHTYGIEWDANQIRTYVDGALTMTVDPGPSGFWSYGDFGLPDDSNPWQYSGNKMAPFDQEFYFLLNVAVGGTNGYFPDNWVNQPYPKPWANTSPQAFLDFWNARNNWHPTWNPTTNRGEDAALQIDYIRVWKLQADTAK